jgi:hypothetical protein
MNKLLLWFLSLFRREKLIPASDQYLVSSITIGELRAKKWAQKAKEKQKKHKEKETARDKARREKIKNGPYIKRAFEYAGSQLPIDPDQVPWQIMIDAETIGIRNKDFPLFMEMFRDLCAERGIKAFSSVDRIVIEGTSLKAFKDKQAKQMTITRSAYR